MISARLDVDATQSIGTVHPHIYGHFIEHLRDCIYNGLWAEMLQNRKFAGHDRLYYGIVMPWLPVGAADHVHYMHDNQIYYVAGMAEGRGQSQRITLDRADGERHGIAQDGLTLLDGQSYELRLVLRATGDTRQVEVGLESESGQRTTATIALRGDDWQTDHLTLAAPGQAQRARFSITIREAGTLWIGAASLMPGDQHNGWRRDVLDLVRGLKPPIVRYPGGNFASNYHWQDGIGDRDRRPVRYDRAWHVYEPNDVGTDEFIAWCRLLQTEPYLCVNTGDGTPEEAAAWVEYCNGPADSQYGRLRAENGHPEPYDVLYWGVGNETYGNWQVGHVDAETFAHECVTYARAMRAIDPRLKILAVSGMPDRWPDWNAAVARIAGNEIDYITLHHYAREDRHDSPDEVYLMTVAAPDHIGDLIDESRRAIDANAPAGKFIAISFDEWNTSHPSRPHQPLPTSGDQLLAGSEVVNLNEVAKQEIIARVLNGPPATTTAERYDPQRWERFLAGVVEHTRNHPGGRQNYALADGLYAAGFFNVMLRNANHITMANQAQLVNLLGIIETSPTDCYGTAEYLAFQLYVDHSGGEAVAATVECPTFDAPALGAMPGRRDVPYIDLAASYDREGKRLFLHVVNRHPGEPVEATITLRGVTPLGDTIAHELTGPEPWSRNSFENHHLLRIASRPGNGAAESFTQQFPPHSATSFEIACQ